MARPRSKSVAGQLASGDGLDRPGAEGRGHGEVEPAGDLAPQRDPRHEGVPEEPWTGQALEEGAIQARRSGEQADRGVLAGAELVQGVGAGRPHEARRQGDGVAAGHPPALLEGGGDDAHVAVGRLDDALGRRGRLAGQLSQHFVGAQRHRVGVDDETVDELGDLVDGVREHPTGDEQS